MMNMHTILQSIMYHMYIRKFDNLTLRNLRRREKGQNASLDVSFIMQYRFDTGGESRLFEA